MAGLREREGRPPPDPNWLNSIQFLGKFGKIMCWRPHWRVGAPTSEKSWIRHCSCTIQKNTSYSLLFSMLEIPHNNNWYLNIDSDEKIILHWIHSLDFGILNGLKQLQTKDWGTMLVVKRSVGVTPEVNLRITLHTSEGSTLDFKPRADVTRSPKQWYL